MVRSFRWMTIAMGLAVAAGFTLVVWRPGLLMTQEPPPPRLNDGGSGVRLPPPEPSPIHAQAPFQLTYTNQDQNAFLHQEVTRMGITNLSQDGEPSERRGALGLGWSPDRRAETMRRLREMNERMAESTQRPVVPIAGETAEIRGGASEDMGGPPFSALGDHWEGIDSSGLVGTRTIQDPSEWRRLWRDLSSSAAPGIDFRRKQVVGVFAGVRPVSRGAVRIVGLVPTATALVVQYVDDAPAPSSAAGSPSLPGRQAGVASPYAMKVIDLTDLPIRFQRVLSEASAP